MKNNLSHISFIMDGNNRWSKKNKSNLTNSYKRGVEKLLKVSKYCFDAHNIKIVSAFALSSHNLRRSSKTLVPIFKILDFYLDEFIKNNSKYNFNIRFIGEFDFFNKEIKKKIISINSNQKLKKTLLIALNYSGTQDIINASNLQNNNKLKINTLLATADYPDPDLLIRTGGYKRLSDYFLFQIAFTELFFTKTLWPDLKLQSLNAIIKNFSNIKRKFGK